MAHRLGLALGVDSVECALTPNAIILTTLAQDHCITTVRKNQDKGINMQVVTEVQRIVITAERKIYDMQQVHAKLARIKPLKYNRYFVMLMIGVSCASFCSFIWWGRTSFIGYISRRNTRHVCSPITCRKTL
ncbi:Inner membrane protein YjjP [Mannheimia haemolytica]|nr:Inner membrane protein YjjP [Mannheimia haemolytica]